MCSIKRLWAAISATKYVIRSKIEGDIVECGVFKGGNLILMNHIRNRLNLNNKIKLPEISMGMTNDYLDALEYGSTYLRIGTGIFGRRTN